jgi:hypothetical protein
VIGERTWSRLLDLVVFAAVLAGIEGLLVMTRYWFGAMTPAAEISRSPRALPLYAFYSVVRIAMAYVLSLLFALGYGYIAAYNKRLEGLMVAMLDILQSIPVLSFLPGVMLAMVALFPTRQLGVEFGAILLIFTGQVWNMAFSFYASLKSIPRELREAARIYGFGKWQRFVPAGAALRRDRPGLELHGVGGGRLVLPDGLRNVRARQARFPAAGAGLISANRRQRRRHGRHLLGPGHHDRRDRADRPDGVAAGHRLVGQVQVRAGGEQRAAVFGGAESVAPVEPAGALPHGRVGAAIRAHRPARGAPRGDCGDAAAGGALEDGSGHGGGRLLGGAILYSLFEAAMTLKTLTKPELISTLQGAAATWARVIAPC